MAYGKVIELFLVNGTADSLVTAELSNWNGKAIKIPRIEIADCQRADIKGPGVYFLFCKNEGEKDSVYIGESENLKERMLQHMQDFSSEKEKYYWNTAVMFTGANLNKALIRYLEDKLVKTAKQVDRYQILTKNTYGRTVLKESSVATMEEFFDNIKILLNAMGYKVLEPLANISETKESHNKLQLETGNAHAECLVTAEGFVVLKGSVINEKTNEPSLSSKMIELRKNLMTSTKVKDLVTTEDILFASASAAAEFVLGYAVSGPSKWKNKDGIPLKELEI